MGKSLFQQTPDGLVVKAPASRAADWEMLSAFPDQVIPVTETLVFQWLPCQVPGVIGSVPEQLAQCQYTLTG